MTEPANPYSILIAEITLAEVAAALAAKARAPQGLSLEERDRAVGRFLQDCRDLFLVVEIERGIIDSAVELTQRHRLRGYDAVQVAAALAANGDLVRHGQPRLTLITADDDLLAAAQSEGLPTDNPLNHED